MQGQDRSKACGSDAPGNQHPLAALGDAKVALIEVGAAGDIGFATPHFLVSVGRADLAMGDLSGRNFATCFPEADPPAASPSAAGCDGEGRFRAADGRVHKVMWSRNAAGGWIGVHQGETPLAATAENTDELTGLGNRTYLKSSFARLAAKGPEEIAEMTAIFLDLDHFKRVNDTLGHGVGDDLLCKVAVRLKKILRERDVVVRLGGDEFGILLPEGNAAAAEGIAVRIIKLLGRPFLVGGHQLTIGASLGLSPIRPGEDGPEKMLQRADIALYESKRLGRGRFRWFRDEMLETLKERREIENDLRKALHLDQFEVVYQPQHSFQQGEISGFEALIRWHHPLRGLVSPMQFIRVAEEIGEIIPIGAWVLGEACRVATTWPDHIGIAVNVSPIQFEDEGFVGIVEAALAASGLAAARLELEITETALLQSEEIVVQRMTRLRGLGVRISLDDFGIGYSSLNYLRKFPFDKVKIDQSFVREPFADETAHQIVKAVAQLGAAFGMSVLAEGVETTEQLARIRSHGCSDAQGYLLSAPMPQGSVAAYLAARGKAALSA